MFIFQRVISLCIFSIILFITYALLTKFKGEKNVKRILVFYLFVLGIMGYFYNPYKTADLYTIREHITNIYTNVSFKDVFEQMKSSRMPLQILYYWFFVQVGNLRLLPCITAMITYFNIFYIIFKASKKLKWDNRIIAKIFIIFMCAGQFVEVISGIRSMLSYSFIALAVYLDYFEEKGFIKTLPLYFIGVFLHDSAYPLLILRIAMLLIQKNKRKSEFSNKIHKVINIISFFSIFFISFFIFENLLIELVEHAKYYFLGGIYFYIWEYIIAFLCMILCIKSLGVYKDINKKYRENRISDNYINFLNIAIIVNMFFFFEYSIFQRYRTFVMMLMLPIIGENLYLISNNNKLKEYQGYKRFLIFFMGIIYLLACVRGNLCNLKFI